jgi:hypothetical protein
MLALRPAAVPVHDYGNMSRQSRQIKLSEQFGLFCRDRAESGRCGDLERDVRFHRRRYAFVGFPFTPQS